MVNRGTSGASGAVRMPRGTPGTTVDYPSREHGNADQSARRRALTVLDEINGIAEVLRAKISNSGAYIDARDGRALAAKAVDVNVCIAEIAQLAEVREWLAADAAEADADHAAEPVRPLDDRCR
jgi:hypothetical protein